MGASRGRQDGSRDSETAVELQRDCQAIKAAIEQVVCVYSKIRILVVVTLQYVLL